MASNLKYSTSLKNAQQDQIATKLGGNARLDLYNGAQPASPDTAITSQVRLVRLTGNSAAFADAASGGVLTARAIANGTGDANAGSGITATWFRLTDSGGNAHVDGTVGISGSDLNIDNPNIAANQTVSVSAANFTNGN